MSISAQKPTISTAGSGNHFSERLNHILAELKQLSADLKSASKTTASHSEKTKMPDARPKLAAWEKPADEVNTVDINKGDTLTKIARRNHTSIDSLIALNGIKNKDRIKAGRKIIISEKQPANNAGQTGPTGARANAMKNAQADQISEPVGPTRIRTGAIAKDVSAYDRDTMIRTVIGEANNQGQRGQEAVAHVLMNRAADPRFPNNLSAVAKQHKQFSAWNSGVGGNSLVRKYNPGSVQYDRAANAVDRVLSGQSKDPTGGATHYYSPAGMRAHVARGEQKNLLPRWLQAMNNERGGGPTKIGGHLFTGKARIG